MLKYIMATLFLYNESEQGLWLSSFNKDTSSGGPILKYYFFAFLLLDRAVKQRQ